jgi:hypothetical protein
MVIKLVKDIYCYMSVAVYGQTYWFHQQYSNKTFICFQLFVFDHA